MRAAILAVLAALSVVAPAAHASSDGNDVCEDEPAAPLIPGLDAIFRPPEDNRDDIAGYLRTCKEELGFTDPAKILPPMKCLDGTEVPITHLLPDGAGGWKERALRAPRTGQPGVDRALEAEDARLYKDLADGKTGCARPQWLSGQCWNYAHVQKIVPDPAKPEITAVLMCRQERFVSPLSKDERRRKYERERTPEAYKDYAYFNDVGFILTNHKTGKTCFAFQKGEFFGGEVLWPDDNRPRPADVVLAGLPGPPPPAGIPREELTRSAHAAWKPPSANGSCTGCHTGGPWMHSPWIDQAKIVPFDVRAGRDASGVMREIPYIPVEYGSYRNQGTHSVITGFVRTASGALETQRCTACHRIGRKGSSCEPNLDRATGAETASGTRFHTTVAGPATAAEAPFSAWMPPPAGGWAESNNLRPGARGRYDASFGPHIAALTCCCANPNARGCSSQNLAQPVLTASVRGTEEPACAVSVAAEIRSPALLTSGGAYRITSGRTLALDGTLTRAADPDAKLQYAWDFGDGRGPSAPSTDARGSYTFTRPGTYDVTLIVSDGHDTDRVTTRVVVSP